jgi:hypothetical protein
MPSFLTQAARHNKMQNLPHIQSFGQRAIPRKNLSSFGFWRVLFLSVWIFAFSQLSAAQAAAQAGWQSPLFSHCETTTESGNQKDNLWFYQTEESHLLLTEVLPDKIEIEEKNPESKQKCKAGLKGVVFHQKIEPLKRIAFLQRTLFLTLERKNCTRGHLPLFLLFHSWKHFLMSF